MQGANAYLKDVYMPSFNKHFAVSASQDGTAYVPLRGFDVDEILSERHERVVSNDNCVNYKKLKLQIPADRHRHHYVRAKVQVRIDSEGQISIYHGPRLLAQYDVQGELLQAELKNGTTG